MFLLGLFLTFNSSVELSKGGWGQLEKKIDILNTGVQSILEKPIKQLFCAVYIEETQYLFTFHPSKHDIHNDRTM